jgi:hypothetical protein
MAANVELAGGAWSSISSTDWSGPMALLHRANLLDVGEHTHADTVLMGLPLNLPIPKGVPPTNLYGELR